MTAKIQTLRKGRTPGSEAPDMLYQYLSPLRRYLHDEDCTEVAVNRPGEVWTETRQGWRRHELPELDFDTCMQLATLVANFNKKAIKPDKPFMSAGLIYSERAQIAIPPACEDNTVSFTIRKPSTVDKSVEELEQEGAFQSWEDAHSDLASFENELLQLKGSRQMSSFLDLAVKSRRNILVVGKTGSGKTTLAKSLVRSIPPTERLITIEDTHELFLQDHPNKVHLFYTREDEGGTVITPKQALVACLRMKPDRILLAELRGDESWEFIKSINTGHPGSISTMHANGALDAFEQLTALIKDSRTGAHLDTDYIKQRLYTTIDVVLYYDRYKLKEVYYEPEFKRKQMA